MAEPKKRTNNSKQGMRRMHDKTIGATIVFCQKCHQAKERHKVCASCGYYGEKQVVEK